jgi:hypothetical protein
MWSVQTMSEAQAEQFNRGIVNDPTWKRNQKRNVEYGRMVNVRDLVDHSLANLINSHARQLALLVEDIYDTNIRIRSTHIQHWDGQYGEEVNVPSGGKGWVSVTPITTATDPAGGLHFPEFGITYQGVKGRTLIFPNWYERTVLPVTSGFSIIRTRHA